MSVFGPPTLLFIPPRPTVTTGIYLDRQVVPSARIEALMRHYQAAGFSKEVSKHTAAPKRPSTNRMYDPLRIECMTTGSYASVTGPHGKDLIHLVPQLLKLLLFCMNFLILMACHLRLSKDTGPVQPESLAPPARWQQSRLILFQT